jgi:hypothetical protein
MDNEKNFNDLRKILGDIKEKSNKSFNNPITDFTPKKKPSFKIKFKTFIANLLTKLKKITFFKKIKNWFKKSIVGPIKDKQAERKHKKYVKELKKNFGKRFNTDVNRITSIMNINNLNESVIDKNEILVQNRLEINKRKSLYKFPPFIYEPQIIDVHNENLIEENPTLNEIISDENRKAWDSVHKQHDFYQKRDRLKGIKHF